MGSAKHLGHKDSKNVVCFQTGFRFQIGPMGPIGPTDILRIENVFCESNRDQEIGIGIGIDIRIGMQIGMVGMGGEQSKRKGIQRGI